jgi:serine protease AprX
MVKRLVQPLGTVLLIIAALHLVVSAQQGPTTPSEQRNAPIRLRGRTFVPTRGERPNLPPGLAAAASQPGQRAYYLVQFQGPILEEWKHALVDAGAEILDYIPEFAFKVRMTPEQAAQVGAQAPVVWVDLFHPAYKLSPDLQGPASARTFVVHVERGANAAAVAQLAAAGGIQVLSRNGSRLTILADAAALEAVARIPDVARIETFRLPIKHNEYAGGVIMGGDIAHAAGFDGSSQTVAVADTGLGAGTLTTAHPDLQPPRLAAILNWPGVAGGCFPSIVDDGPIDVSTGHGTHTTLAAVGSGGPAGQGRGMAPGARLIFQAVENWAVPSALCALVNGIGPGYYLVGLPGDLRVLFQQAYDAGARIHSNSWGAETAGAYTADSAEADDFVWTHRDMTLTFSAGNAGTDANSDGIVDSGSMAAPATAKNVIAVGASENDRQSRWDCDRNLSYTDCAANGGQNTIFTYGSAWPSRFPVAPLFGDAAAGNARQMAGFSSRGPADDGRIKPDLVAPGTWVLSGYSDAFQQQYDATPNPQNGQYQYDGWGTPLNQRYKYMGGTSMSNPLVAGAAAVVRDFYHKALQHEASSALVKATLVNSAVDLLDENNDGVDDNAFPIPNNHEGWGLVNVAAAVSGQRRFFDEGAGLTTNGSWVASFGVDAGSPLKVTLAWSDYASSTTAAKNLVNDLDLRLTAPNGTSYYGNAFSGGWSQSGAVADRTNNLENVYIQTPPAGEWIIEVIGFNVPMGPQPFALVIDGRVTGLPSTRPTVTVAPATATAREAGAVTGSFVITRGGDVDAALTVRYSIAGTATAGTDYLTLPGTVTIPAGATTAVIVVTPLDDSVVEPDETVILNVIADPAYGVGAPASAVVTIVSDDAYPDLVVSALTAPSRAAAGSVITLDDTTKNQGAGPAPGSMTSFYLSTNLAIDGGDAWLGSRSVLALTAGASQSASTSVTIPAGTANGSYYVLARADDAATVTEAVETNNVKFSGVLQIGADLTVSALTAPATAGAGTQMTVVDSTTNLGTSPVPSTVTTFYLSANLIVDASDWTLGSRTVPALAAGVTDTASTTLTLPAVGTGTYYVLAQADAASAVAETSETNNVRYSGAVKIGPDLNVSALTVPAIGAAGGTITVNDTTGNVGGGAAPASTTNFYLSVNLSLEASDRLIGSRTVPQLSPGTSAAAATVLTIPADMATGVYYLFAQADGPANLTETTETNNAKFAGPVQIGPDLIVSTLIGPTVAGAGSSISITDTTRNQGAGAAPPSVTAFYLSVNAALDGSDVLIGSRTVSALDGGANQTVTTTLSIPAGTLTGTYYLVAQADGTAALTETSETNNLRFGTTIRIGPDLMISGLTVPTATVAPGSSIQIGDTTLNQGAGAATSSSTAFYLSANSTLDASDVKLGSRSVAPLAAGGSQSGSTTVVIPATTTPGTYYVLIQADGDAIVDETSETNNGRIALVRVGP